MALMNSHDIGNNILSAYQSARLACRRRYANGLSPGAAAAAAAIIIIIAASGASVRKKQSRQISNQSGPVRVREPDVGGVWLALRCSPIAEPNDK